MALTVSGFNRLTANSVELRVSSAGIDSTTFDLTVLDAEVAAHGTTVQQALWKASSVREILSKSFSTSAAATIEASQKLNLTLVRSAANGNPYILSFTYSGGGPYTPAISLALGDIDAFWLRIRVNPSQIK